MGMENQDGGEGYDEMDYGDEFNDSEEKRYRKETYGDDQGQGDDNQEEGEEEGEEEESSFDPPEVVPLAKEFSRRANRGNRMSALVGKALDEDDDFWGGVGKDFFGGGLDDEANG
jgi:hypothetical protein